MVVNKFSINTLIAVDPGANGGIATMTNKETVIYSMPDNPVDLFHLLSEAHNPFRTRMVIERVGGFVRGAYEGSFTPGNAMFGFGKKVGWVEMAAAALGLVDGETFIQVTPEKWQRDLGVEPRRKHKEGKKTVYDETKTEFKNRLKSMAKDKFPELADRITLKTSDALLLLDWLTRRTK